jgi:cytochrome c-type biogenesis protein CcsB
MLVYASLVCLAIAMVAFSSVFASRRAGSLSKKKAAAGLVGAPGEMASQDAQDQAGDFNHADLDKGSSLRARAVSIGLAVTWLATALLGAALVARGLSVGRAPWGNMYEFAISSAFASLLVLLVVSLKRSVAWLAVWVIVPVFALTGLAVTVLYTEAGPLVPALDSAWLVVHVAAAIIAFGAFTVAAGTSVAFFIIKRMRERGSQASWLVGAPSIETLDRLTYRMTAFAFPIWTFAVIAGAIWAENAWGRYWGWDPKETWALISWVIYAAYLHARVTAGWAVSRSMVIGLAGYASLLFNFFGVNILIPGLHSYAGV